jgi:preprotein translocase subunit SecG
METVIIVVHLMVIVALVAVVLMQRSEGGALGIGGGGNFLSTRGQANVLTRTTAILAIAFFATSLLLSVLTRFADRPSSILDTVPSAAAPTVPTEAGAATGSEGGVLDQLEQMSAPPAAETVPAAPADSGVPTGQ